MAKKADSKNRKKKTKVKKVKTERDIRKRREIQALIIIALGFFFAIAMFFGITGIVGDAIEEFFKGCFGIVSYLLPFYLLIYGALMLIGRTKILRPAAAIFFILLFLSFAMVNSIRFVTAENLAAPLTGFGDEYESGIVLESGGIAGMMLASLLVKLIGKAGAYIAAALICLISVIVIADKPYAEMANWEEKSDERKAKRAARAEEKKLIEAEKVSKVKERPAPQPVRTEHQVPDYTRTRKAISRSKLSDNQKNILGLMTDDSLSFGSSGKEYEGGYGLDGSQQSLTQPDRGLNKDYDKGDMGRKEYQGYTGGYINFAEKESETKDSESPTETKIVSKDKAKQEEKLTNREARSASLEEKDFNDHKTSSSYSLPPLKLLKKVEIKGADLTELAAKTKLLEETLQSFNVDARVVDAIPGPTVTRYEIQPNAGVKVSKIVSLKDDIALKLQAKSIRIEAPIPGKAAVGVEVENDRANTVSIREIIESDEFRRSSSKISFSVGKDITGRAIIGDLKSMPHLLIAGSTGSGKSVCINSIITSILYKARPEEVKLVLIDPKVVELGNYNGIPHLLIPVVTKPEKAAASLNWAVAEMNERYRKFAETGVRDLASYNEHVKADGGDELVMPQIVIIIDELADLMMAAPSQVEESICRLAQMARAAGMHLIVATQRPSVDVITGVIKANIPSRIAFAVSSQFDSRTILDMGGAEKLIGKGDMLYSPLGMGKPVRVQGCFISDDEVNSVIAYVKSQVKDVTYSDDIINSIDKTGSPSVSDDIEDELLPDCIDFVVNAGQASVSMLQRRFRIGYNRAARIMDMMEERQIVGPQDGSRPRQVLVSQEEISCDEPASEDKE